MTDLVRTGRAAYARRDWAGARDALRGAHEDGDLSPDDLYLLGDAAWWLGDVDESMDAWEAAYRRYLQGEQPRDAAMSALGIAVNLFLRGDAALGQGWVGRARRLVADEPDCPEHGYLVYLLEVEGPLGGITPSEPGATDALIARAREVRDIGHRHDEPNLVALSLMGEGRARVKAGDVDEGLRLLDEAMVAVLSDDLSPEWAGNVYCHLMSAAHEVADVHRSVAWTQATSRWLETLPAAVLFTGICRVHRSQVHQLTGSWDVAEREADRVCRDLIDIQPASAAEAHYQVGEIRRLRGDLDAAEQAYLTAHRLGRDPQPGLALLRLAQGRVDAAAAAIRTALLAAGDDRLARARLCAARTEVALAAGDADEAGRAADELADIAGAYATPGLEVMSRHATGSVLLATGRAAEALPVLRDACRRWQDVDAPYDCARVRTVLAEVYDALDDPEAARLERRTAAEVFRRLGAHHDAARLAPQPVTAGLPDGLTAREAEVLSHVATGCTNREIAASLVISEKTVARHLSNIFTKLGVASRTAAAAYAFEHDLASPAPR